LEIVVGSGEFRGHVRVLLDPRVGVEPAALVAAWEGDEAARALGSAVVEPVAGETFLPGVVELIAIPLLVNVASGMLSDTVKRLVAGRRPHAADEIDVVEVAMGGERVLVVRRRIRP
jgi:hypothetical protein